VRLILTALLLAIIPFAPVPAARAASGGIPRSALDGQVKAKPSKARPAPRHRKRAPRHTARRPATHRAVTKAKAPVHRAPAPRAVSGELTLV
jgi:hypothetical protein